MIAAVKSETLYIYYDAASVEAIVEQGKLIFIVDIPVADVRTVVNQFQLTSVPLYWPPIDAFISTDAKGLFLTTKDRKFYYSGSRKILDNCIKTKQLFCPFKIQLIESRTSSCELNVFKDVSTQNCSMMIKSSDTHYFEPYEDGYIYSTKDKIEIQAVCYYGSTMSNTTKIDINGVGYLTNVKHCDLFSDYFSIHATRTSTLKVSLHTPKIDLITVNVSLLIPPSHTLHNVEFATMLKDYLKETPRNLDFKNLERQITRQYNASKEKDVTDFPYHIHTAVSASAVSTLLIIFVICIVLCLYYRNNINNVYRSLVTKPISQVVSASHVMVELPVLHSNEEETL